jgi:hypothetical protein
MNSDELVPAIDLTPRGHAVGRLLSRPWLLIALCMLLCAFLGVWYFWTPPMTPTEMALVGKWTLPMVPNPPSNAVQQVYWLQPGGKFLFGGRPIGDTSTRYGMAGTWRLEDGHLILKAQRRESLADDLAQLFGQAPHSGLMDERIRILSHDGAALQIEGAGGSVCTLLR